MASMNKFFDLALALESATQGLPKRVADQGVEHVKQHIIDNGQVLTGYMRDSVESAEVDGTEANFFVGAEYGAYQNYGTRYLPPRPFWEPAIIETQADLDAEMDAIVALLAGI